MLPRTVSNMLNSKWFMSALQVYVLVSILILVLSHYIFMITILKLPLSQNCSDAITNIVKTFQKKDTSVRGQLLSLITLYISFVLN